MSVERIVLRACMGDQTLAKELLARGFAPDLLPTSEGRKVAQTVLALRSGGTALTLENVRLALGTRKALPANLRRYFEALGMMPCCSKLHAVGRLQMLQLDLAMARANQVSRTGGMQRRAAYQSYENTRTRRKP